MHLDFVECSGLEYGLDDCETVNSGTGMSHSLDVGVKCQPGYQSGAVSSFCSSRSITCACYYVC